MPDSHSAEPCAPASTFPPSQGRAPWWKRWPSRVWWFSKAMATGRTYYVDAPSERANRRWIWKVYGPNVDVWPLDHPWLGERDDCGCLRWRIIHRPAIWCMDHPEGDSFNAIMREIERDAAALHSTAVYTFDPTNRASNCTGDYISEADQ